MKIRQDVELTLTQLIGRNDIVHSIRNCRDYRVLGKHPSGRYVCQRTSGGALCLISKSDLLLITKYTS